MWYMFLCNVCAGGHVHIGGMWYMWRIWCMLLGACVRVSAHARAHKLAPACMQMDMPR